MRKILLTGIAMMTIAISSCDDQTYMTGNSLTTDVDRFSIESDTFDVQTKSILAGSVISRSTYTYLGRIKDPETGSYITSDFATAFSLLENESSNIFAGEDIIVNKDSLGIVADSCGTLFIVHAVPGEPDFKGDPDRVKASTPQQFFSTEYTTIGEVLRPADSLVGRRAGEHAWRLYQRHTLFDHDYDDADTTRMYCTELVAYAYRQAGHDVDQGRRHHVNLPILQGECMFPSDIYASDFLTSVIHF